VQLSGLVGAREVIGECERQQVVEVQGIGWIMLKSNSMIMDIPHTMSE
jgi:hypothetical protein